MNNLDPEKLKIPAYLRKKGITTRAKQKLILTALDRKNAGLSPTSARALAEDKHKRKSKKKYLKPLPLSGKQATAETGNEPNKLFRFLGTTAEKLRQQTQKKSPQDSPRTLSKESIDSTEDRLTEAKFIPIGTVLGYYEKINVAIIHIEKPLRVGEIIQLSAGKFLFQQVVHSLQIDRKDVSLAPKNSDIGLKVAFPPEKNSPVYKKVSDEQDI